jgi:hypothetical protein
LPITGFSIGMMNKRFPAPFDGKTVRAMIDRGIPVNSNHSWQPLQIMIVKMFPTLNVL